MKNIKSNCQTRVSKWVIALAFTLLFQLTTFAEEDPAEFGDTGDANPTDAPVAPIDDYVWFLMGAGIVYTFYKHHRTAMLKKESGLS